MFQEMGRANRPRRKWWGHSIRGWEGGMKKVLVGVALLLASVSAAQAQSTVRIGVATSGGTTMPALVISQQKLDEKQGLKIEWVRLDQNALQKAFALRQFDVSFAEVASDLIRQRARGDKVTSVYCGIMANVYVVTKKDAPYQNFGDLMGKKVGLYSLTSSSTAALIRIVRDRWKLDLRKDFEPVVAPPPVLVGLLQKGEIEAMVNVDPLVLHTLETGGYRQIMDLDGEWQELTGSRLLVTTVAVWDDYAAKNPDQVKRIVQVYRDAVSYIEKHPEVYAETGFIKMSGLEATPSVTKAFQERFTKLYTGAWNQKLIDANKAVFEVATEMGNLGAMPTDWYSFDYAK
jgi:ABC-type nitrate/sulfonate/bicarbonate transport system substrate-binding protein